MTPRIAEVFINFVITWCVDAKAPPTEEAAQQARPRALRLFLGNLYLGSGEGKNENYFESKSMNNILLRSMAARREGRTYSYCVVVLWTVIITIGEQPGAGHFAVAWSPDARCSRAGSVVLPAYIIFMAPTIFFVVYSGEVLTDMATLFLLFDYILKWEQKSLYLIQFAACLTAEQRVGTTTYVQGARATAEIRAQSFAYLWYGGILMFVLLISYHCARDAAARDGPRCALSTPPD